MKQLIIHQQSIRSSDSQKSQLLNDNYLPVRIRKEFIKTRQQSVALPDKTNILVKKGSSWSSESSLQQSMISRISAGSIFIDESQLNCLIANDEPLQLQILEHIFVNENFNVVTSRNGFEAFEYVQKNLKELNACFDLIILDLNMPIADGYEAIKNINNLYTNHHIFKIAKDHVHSNSRKNEQIKTDKVQDDLFKPIIIACTGMVNEIVKVQTQ